MQFYQHQHQHQHFVPSTIYRLKPIIPDYAIALPFCDPDRGSRGTSVRRMPALPHQRRAKRGVDPGCRLRLRRPFGRTRRDGLQGAAFASNDDPESSHRGVVQVGNPFLEKLLLEACLAALETGDVVVMQDLGAAGLTSSAVEMAARGSLGYKREAHAMVARRRDRTGI